MKDELRKKTLHDINGIFTPYPIDKTIHELFEAQVDQTPDNIALVQQDQQITYKKLDEQANQLAHYLLSQYDNNGEEIVAILQEQSMNMIVSILGVLKAGFAFLTINPLLPEESQKHMLKEACSSVIISTKSHIRLLNRLQWECENIKTFICLDSNDVYGEEEENFNPLMDKKLWDYVGEESEDSAGRGGWKSSFTGELFTSEELIECSSNVLTKLRPYINKETRILEIGCSSGITMFTIAPLVKFYHGTDLSDVILEETRKQAAEEGHSNIYLQTLAADEMDKLSEKDFDIIIFNSVIQAFHGHNYFRQVMAKATKLLKEKGIIFMGDIMDQNLKNPMISALKDFEKEHENSRYVTKTDFSNELFLSSEFFQDLLIEQRELKTCVVSRKNYSIKNELTEYRYDVIIEVDKKNPDINKKQKVRLQHGLQEIRKFPTDRVIAKVKSDNLAYVIFTSGSTGKPKGVMVEHRTLVNMCFWYNSCHHITAEDRSSNFANCGFDASLIEIFPILIKGASIYILNSETKSDLNKLNKYFEDNRITICYLPTQYCEQFMEIENNSLRIVNTGGEKLKKFTRRKYTLVDNYGPTECTVVSSYFIVDKQSRNIPIGKPIYNTRIYILDEDKQILPPGKAGELYIAGAGLARGYLNRPELTREKFIADPFNFGERMYRTGDIGRWSLGGNLEFLGRIDNQVKIRGYRIELGEIESRILEHRDMVECVVTVHTDGCGENALYAYIVVKKSTPISEIKGYLAKEIPPYMIPTHFYVLEAMPLTSNGKIDKKALPLPIDTLYNVKEFSEPSNDYEKRLAEIWGEVLCVSNIGTNDDFFDIGGHSLKVLKVANQINKEFNVELSAAELFKARTIQEQGELIKESKSKKFYPIISVEKKEYYTVSPSQKRIFVIQHMEVENTAYNIPFLFSMKGEISKEKLRVAFHKVITKHEIMRTDFHMINETVVQRVKDELHINIEYEELKNENVDKLIEEFVRPFDLSIAPLFRVKLVKLNKEECLLLIDIHHIILDGSSMEILWEEFSKAYNEEDMGQLKIQYKDFSEWQLSKSHQESLREQSKYWLEQFSGEIPILKLPLDSERPEIQSFQGEVFTFSINSEITSMLKELARSYDVSMNMLLLAVYKVMLSKYSHEEDIIVGTPVYGRNHSDLKNLIGMFASTLALRSYPHSSKSFSHYLIEIKQILLKALDNQDFPFEQLVEKLNVTRDIRRNPLFDTMFVMQKFTSESLVLKNIIIKRLNPKLTKSRFDMTWFAELKDDTITINIEYCTKLYKKDSITRTAGHFLKIIDQITKDPNILISKIALITEVEKLQILNEFNYTRKYSNENKLLCEVFQKVVEENKKKIALSFNSINMSYEELNRRANKLASYLRKKGVKRDTVVALVATRSFEMIIGVLGIIKAGGACLPINPEYPQEYIDEILEDSKVKILIRHLKEESNKLSFQSEKFLVVDMKDTLIELEKDSNLKSINESWDMLYIIYTSGTSGKPKGVIIENKTFINLINYQQNETDIDFQAVLQFAAITFDVSFQEIFSCLLSGGKLLLISEGDRTNILRLFNEIQKEKIRTLFLPPALIQLLFNEKEYIEGFPSSVKHIISAGEQLLVPASLKEFIKKNKIFLYNHYGPSETHVVTTLELDPTKSIANKPSIGKAIANRSIYILGKNNELLPIGVAGELCIGGEGLAGGYLHEPALTKTKFQKDPFKEEGLMYRSNDLARWLFDGSIEFLGRIDDQIKIRGYRIEPAAIERILLNYYGIRKVIVMSFEEKNNKYLCAYILANVSLNPSDLKGYLLKQLPAYMVPTHFVILKEFPFNLNGKIERKRLPHPMDMKESKSQDTMSSMEKRITEIWKEVLELEDIGLNDDFFELGGQSLRAIMLMLRLKKVFNKDLPGSIVFKYSTVKKLALFLETDLNNTVFTHLVEITQHGGNNKIFCIHPAPGTVICYYNLAKYLKPEWSVYAFQAKGLEKGQVPHATIEEMATAYIKEMKKIQIKGPYILLGWSVGGRIAYEIAQQLSRQGDEMEFLAMLDTDPDFITKVNSKPRALPLFIYGMLAMFTHGKIIYKNLNITSLGLKNLWRRLTMWVTLIRAVKKYRPLNYKGNGKILLFQTKEGARIQSRLKVKSRSINSFIEDLEVVSVKGRHLEMLSEPNIRDILSNLKPYLDQYIKN
ncbi:MAG: amino acid adenylation domain-containing protein [Clostridiaceae bacterium]|nr:amino acid adenylation domain-containing protein [Clostridiaceae bacterium]